MVGKLVRVRWLDTQTLEGWISADEVKATGNVLTCETTGRVIEDTDLVLSIGSSWCSRECVYSSITRIPRPCVLEVVEVGNVL